MVKLYNEVPADFLAASPDRVGRSCEIYPHVFEPNFHELGYFMPVECGRDVLKAQREVMLRSLPDSRIPLEVRFVAPDTGWLSPNHGRASIVLSV